MAEYIIIPGEYSGDMWHVVAACIVRPTLQVLIGVLSDAKKELEGAKAIAAFFKQVGLGDRVQILAGNGGFKTVVLAGKTRVIKELGGKPVMWQHVALAQDKFPNDTIPPLYACTSMIMRAMEELGKTKVIAGLRAGLTANLGLPICEHVAGHALGILKKTKAKKVLFVLGRNAGYNPQHDLDAKRLGAIAKAAAKAKYHIVLVGWPKWLNELAKEVGLKKFSVVDLRDWVSLTGIDREDERARAYFWRCVVEIAAKLGIDAKFVGGRSGSTDLPGFMGMDVLSWDIFDANNPEYLRLLLTAPLLMKVTHVDVDTPKHGSISIVPKQNIDLCGDVLAFLCNEFVQPPILFAVSKSFTKAKPKKLKKGEKPPNPFAPCLITLLDVATIVFIPSTTPLAFDALEGFVDEVGLSFDLAPCFQYQDNARSLKSSGLSQIVECSSFSPQSALFYLRVKKQDKQEEIEEEKIEHEFPKFEFGKLRRTQSLSILPRKDEDIIIRPPRRRTISFSE